MRFIVRSPGGKLIVGATLILLSCMLLFIAFTWSLLRLYSQHEADSAAQTHLALIERAYQARTNMLKDELGKVTTNTSIISAITQQPSTQATQEHLQSLLVEPFTQNHLSMLSLVSPNRQWLAQLANTSITSQDLASTFIPLVEQALQGQTVSTIQSSKAPASNTSGPGQPWSLSIAMPMRDSTGTLSGVLLASQAIDDDFAQMLVQGSGMRVLLCIEDQIQGSSGITPQELTLQQNSNERKVCAVGASNKLSGTQSYLTRADSIRDENQAVSSATLVFVTVEPLYSLNASNIRLLLLMTGLGLFIFGPAVFAFAFMTRALFVRPLRQLQTHVQALIMSSSEQQVPQSSNELTMLRQSFNLLADCLESENEAMAEQMSNLLIMSDALISTLNLEHLLGEIVTRLGYIMKAKHVSLLLYGREMLSPWAVAQWSEVAGKVVDSYSTPNSSFSHSLQQQGAVTVHADPDGDITLAITTKMAAISGAQLNRTSGKRKAVQGEKSTQNAQPYGLRRPRIPRLALRDLDLILARMVIQRHKIAYGEDIATIYRERKENWARMAMEAGYRSAIAVPLLLQDQAIGAFILYTDTPHLVSSRDTFLLSTAAVQASVAIQNALLFAEVKEKNAALERASHLKSQFLANVTHELRTPLHSIISYGALILEGFVDGELTTEQEEHIQFMVNRAEDLSRLVDDMLDLSKIEADRIEIKIETLEMRPCLMEVVNQLKPMANNKKLYLNLEMDEGLPTARADSHRLRQVVINLVSNALKFTEKGGVTIRCRLVHNDEMVHISVSDTGIGISPAALGYIFEAFRQADGSTTRRFGGTGLGLTIARKLIELQGGEVAVESVPGHGSTFSFTLPVETKVVEAEVKAGI